MKKNESGQALIELIIFLPLMFALYGMISGFANAIYGSINQQKIARSYFYFRIQGNSMIPKTKHFATWKKYGMFYIGWLDKSTGSDESLTPSMPCYQISIPMTPAGNDNCDNTSFNGDSTQFIRVGTVYGMCGATFAKHPVFGSFLVPDMDGADFRELLDVNSCLIK